MRIYAKTKDYGKLFPIVFAAIGLCSIYRGVTTLSNGTSGLVGIGLGILLLLVAFYKPQTAIDKEGVDQIMSFVVYKKHSFWKWSEIGRLFADYEKAKPDVIIIVQRKGVSDKFTVLKEDVPQIIQWAAAANEEMTIMHNGNVDITVPGRETMSEEEYNAAREMEKDIKPENFHQFANEARKIKAEKEQIVAEAKRKKQLKKLKTKQNDKNLKGWK